MRLLSKFRIELAIFLTLFIAYSYFHQGGGWSNNSRFAQVRSIVEEGRFEINNYMIYRVLRDSDGKPKLRRLAVPPGMQLEEITLNGNSGDISLFDGRVYPNKAPGAVFAAVPAYFAIYHIERAFGINPDDWWPLTINAYLARVLSVSLLAALGGVVFYRVSLRLFPSSPPWTHAASTVTFGLGTLMLPFATMFFEHDIVALLSLLGFWLLLIEKNNGLPSPRSMAMLVMAGMLTGLTMVMNYSSIISLGLLMLFGVWVVRPRWQVLFFIAGAVLPMTFLAWYHLVCFGSVLANVYTYQNPIFQDKEALLFGMFGIPRPNVMIKLLFSSYQGLFFTSPVLVLSCLGFWLMAAREGRHPELTMCLSIFGGFLLMNSAFNNWHAGWTVGPRYLIPALPFLSLPLTLVFGRFPRITLALAALSASIMLLATAVDPQMRVTFGNPLTQYLLPLVQGKKLIVSYGVFRYTTEGAVSANPIGVYDSVFYAVFQPGTIQRQWNSFNLGEFFWTGSPSSLVPLLCLLCLGLGAIWKWSRS